MFTVRLNIFNNLKKLNFNLTSICSKHALVSKYSKIGEGSVVMHGAIIGPNVIIGKNCIINSFYCILQKLLNNHFYIGT